MGFYSGRTVIDAIKSFGSSFTFTPFAEYFFHLETRMANKSWHHHDHCIFQSIPEGAIDQRAFTWLGGRVDPQADKMRCQLFDTQRCGCATPSWSRRRRTVVEIGANDGLHMSNSYFFTETLGWRGLCIEPNPRVFVELLRNRPRCINVNAVVGRPADFNGSTVVPFLGFFRNASQHKTDQRRDWETGLSGVENWNRKDGNKRISSLKRAQAAAERLGVSVERSMVPVRSFASIFEEHAIHDVDFMSVDVRAPDRPRHVRGALCARAGQHSLTLSD